MVAHGDVHVHNSPRSSISFPFPLFRLQKQHQKTPLRDFRLYGVEALTLVRWRVSTC